MSHVLCPTSHLTVVRASAGSGKTFALAADYCATVVADPSAYRRILAVTFTNKATGEMKRRILSELHGLAAGRIDTPFGSEVRQQTALSDVAIALGARAALHAILTDYGAFSVTTIDAFFQRIVRSFFRELGLDFSYAVQIDSRGALALAIDLLVEASTDDPLVGQLIDRVVGERLDEGKKWDVTGAIEALGGELLKEAYRAPEYSPTELIERYRALKEAYDRTNAELRAECGAAVALIQGAGLSPADFKWGRTSFTHYLWRTASGRGAIEGYGSRLVAAIEDPETMLPKGEKEPLVRSIIEPMAAVLTRFLVRYNQTQTERRTFEVMADRFTRYVLLERLKEQFDAVMAESGKLAISRTTSFIDRIAREASVPFVFEKLGSRYERIFIDEFQDTSEGQWRGFRPLVDEVIGSGGKVVLIGDVKQAIYRWRGGDWTILGGGLDREFVDIDYSRSLNTSYRSARGVVEFNNALWQGLVGVVQDEVVALLDGERGELFDRLLTAAPSSYRGATQEVAPNKQEGGYVATQTYTEAQESLQYTVDWVVDAIARGYAPGDIAVLVRTHAEGVRVADRLATEGIAVLSDELQLVARSKKIGLIVALWRLALTRDPVALVAVNRATGRGLLDPIDDQFQLFLDRLAALPPVEALEETIQYYQLSDQDSAYIQAFYEELYRFSGEESPDLAAFLAHWQDLASKSLALPSLTARRDAVQLLTIHKAKGLEFDVVCIPWADWSARPKSGATQWVSTQEEPYSDFNPYPVSYNDGLAESVYRPDYLEQGVYTAVDNLNLLYVALTRAAQELYIGLPEKPKKGTVGLWLSQTLEQLQWGGSVGVQQRVERAVEPPVASLLRSTPSYPASAALSAPDPIQ